KLKTGEVVWRHQDRRPSACVLAADGHLYLRHGNGLMVLAEATPQGYREKGQFMPPERTRFSAWTYPTLAGGRLYLRDQDVLLCSDLRADRPAAPPERFGPEPPEKEPRAPDANFVPSPPDVVERMLELAQVKKTDLVVDLGCGDGRIVVAAAKKYGCKAVGYD